MWSEKIKKIWRGFNFRTYYQDLGGIIIFFILGMGGVNKHEDLVDFIRNTHQHFRTHGPNASNASQGTSVSSSASSSAPISSSALVNFHRNRIHMAEKIQNIFPHAMGMIHLELCINQAQWKTCLFSMLVVKQGGEQETYTGDDLKLRN